MLEKLKSSEHELRKLLNLLGEGVAIVDLNEEFTFANYEAERIFGVENGQLDGRSLYEFLADSEREKIIKQTLMRKNKKKSTYEIEIIKPSGSRADVLVTVTPRYDNSGAITGALGTFRDITERKKTEKALRDSEKKYRGVVEDTPHLICCYLPGGEITFVNKSYCEYFRKRADEFIGSNFLDLIPDSQRNSVKKVFARFSPESPVIVNEHQVITPGGDIRWQRWTDRAIFDENGEISFCQAIGEDITEYKNAEKELKDRKQRLELAMEAGGLGGWDFKIRTGELNHDRKMAEMMGYRSEEIVNRIAPWIDLVHPDDLAVAARQLKLHLKGESDFYEVIYRMKHKSGEWRWILSRGKVTEWDEQGEPIRVCGTQMDVTKQKKAFRILQKEKKERTTILDAQPNHVILHEPDLRIQWANRAACRSAGLSREEITGQFCYNIWSETDEPCPECPVIKAIRTGETGTIVKETPDGKFWRITGAPIFNEKGKTETAIEIAEDISEERKNINKRKKAEEELRRSERKYREILENIQSVYYRTDKDGKLIMASPSAADVFGYESVEEMYGMDIAEDIYANPEEREAFLRKLERDYEVRNYETRLKRRDGSTLTVLANCRIYRDKEEKAMGVEGLLVDISSRKKAEDRLASINHELKKQTRALARANKEKENMLRSLNKSRGKITQLLSRNGRLINSMSQVLIGIDAEGRIFQWNKRAEDLLGIAAGRAIGRRISQCGIEWDWEVINHGLDEARSNNRRVRKENISYTRSDGTEGLLYIEYSPSRDANNNSIEWLILATDTTEKKNIEMQLHHAQKLESIGQLAAGIAHEINTPMQYIGDNAMFLEDSFAEISELLKIIQSSLSSHTGDKPDLLLEQISAAINGADIEYILDEVPPALKQSFEGIRRVSKIVKSMKEFSHPGSTEKIPVDINRSLDTTITISRNEWKYVSEIETDFSPDLPEVPCLEDEVNQVFLNLIINAADAIEEKIDRDSGEKGRIRISTRQEGNEAVIRISDTGIGIPEEGKHKIFNPFYTTKEVGEGSGQGLAIGYSIIVDKHGGGLTCNSDYGEGAEFTVRLPLNSGDN